MTKNCYPKTLEDKVSNPCAVIGAGIVFGIALVASAALISGHYAYRGYRKIRDLYYPKSDYPK